MSGYRGAILIGIRAGQRVVTDKAERRNARRAQRLAQLSLGNKKGPMHERR